MLSAFPSNQTTFPAPPGSLEAVLARSASDGQQRGTTRQSGSATSLLLGGSWSRLTNSPDHATASVKQAGSTMRFFFDQDCEHLVCTTDGSRPVGHGLVELSEFEYRQREVERVIDGYSEIDDLF